MRNRDALEFFSAMSQNSDDPKSVKLAHVSDFSQMDADFILRYANSRTRILDMGSGIGLVLNKIYDKVENISQIQSMDNDLRFIILL